MTPAASGDTIATRRAREDNVSSVGSEKMLIPNGCGHIGSEVNRSTTPTIEATKLAPVDANMNCFVQLASGALSFNSGNIDLHTSVTAV
jgi:hypothetical protein